MPNSKEDKPKSKKISKVATVSQRNLINLADRPKEERVEIARKGAAAATEVKKEKKLVSQILSDYLQKEHEVVLRDDSGEVIDREKISAEELINRTVTAVMARGDSASATMLKTLGELTEGKNVNLSGHVETNDLTEGMTLEQKKELVAEWLKKNSR